MNSVPSLAVSALQNDRGGVPVILKFALKWPGVSGKRLKSVQKLPSMLATTLSTMSGMCGRLQVDKVRFGKIDKFQLH